MGTVGTRPGTNPPPALVHFSPADSQWTLCGESATPRLSATDWNRVTCQVCVQREPLVRNITTPRPLEGESATLSVPASTRWVAGWNMPGYLPESDPEGFDDWQDAITYLREEVDRFWESDATDPGNEFDANNEDDEASRRWLPVHTALHSATPDAEFTAFTGDDRLVLWVQEVGE